ncbi:MAG: PAS domain S-box protein [Deltaproteobacteria bacterium]|nr:PAS domain S-box protein [Deltaproteobacteria bacterium]
MNHLKEKEENISKPNLTEKYKGLLYNSLNAFAYHKLVTDEKGKPIDYIILEVNERFEQYTGLSKENILGKKITEIIPEIKASKPNLIELYGEIAISGQSRQFDMYFEPLRKHYQIQAFSIQKGYFAVFFNDITERKNREEKLKKEIAQGYEIQKELRLTQENFQSVLSNLPDVFYRTDMDGTITDVTPESFNTIGFEPHEMIGKPMADFYHHPDERAKVVQAIIDGKGRATHVEAAMRHKNGDVIWVSTNATVRVNSQGEPYCIEGIARNISDKKRYELALIRENVKTQRYLDIAGVILVVLDEFGKVTLINKKGCEVLGYKEEDIIGKGWVENFVPERFHDKLKHVAQKVLRDEKHVDMYGDNPVLTKSGEERWIAWVNTTVHNDMGEIVGTLSSGEDITERRKMLKALEQSRDNLEQEVERRTHELKKAKEEAESANQAKNDFLSNISHEIRTPMHGILGMTEGLLNSTLSEDQKTKCEIILNSGQRLVGILSNILEITKIEAGKIKVKQRPFSIWDLLKTNVDLFQGSVESKGLKLTYEIDPEVRNDVIGDYDLMETVLTNLIANAVKFTESGFIKIHVTRVFSQDKSPRTRFEVLDTGIGVAKQYQKSIFNAFSQEDNSPTRKYSGTGLGLSISYKLVQLMGGVISLASEKGKGSRFWFDLVLPDYESSLKDNDASDQKEIIMGEGVGGINILLVEDDYVNQRVVLSMLEDFDYKIDVASNGKEALELFSGNNYDIILMDCLMPQMDGFETTLKIREKEKENTITPIIALTAKSTKQIRNQCIQVGIQDFLSKPFSRNQLLELISKWIA